MAKSAVEYFTAMCQEAGKTTEEIAALTAIMQDPKLAAKFDETVRRATDDFAAMQGRVAVAEKKVKQYDDEWYPKANAEYQRALRELEDAKATLAANQGGNGNGIGSVDISKFLTKDDLAAHQKNLDERYATVIKQGLRLASRHAAKYHEELDVDALEKLAGEKGLTLDAAYRELIAPRESAEQKDKFEKEKKEAVEQAVKDYASRHKLPVDTAPPETAPIYRGAPAEKDKVADMDAELLDAWHGRRAGAPA